MKQKSKDTTIVDVIWPIATILFILSLPAAWLTHVVVCLSASKWGFLIAGALFFPVGIIHGFGIWLGVW